MVASVLHRELIHWLNPAEDKPIYLSFLHQPIGDGMQMQDPQLQQTKAGTLKAVCWVHRQHAPSLVRGHGTLPGAGINPASRSPASPHKSLTGDSRDACSPALPPTAAQAGLPQDLDAQDPWCPAPCRRGTALHRWCPPSTFCQAETRSSCFLYPGTGRGTTN